MKGIVDDLLEGRFTFRGIGIPKRLLIPLLVVFVAKIAGAAIVYSLLNIQVSGTFWFDVNRVFSWSQNTVFLENVHLAPRLSYAFVGWDSAWYLSIMTRGYGFSPNSYAFSPGFPIFSWVLSLIFGNPVVSAALCGLVFGILSVPFFQVVAESYISKQKALGLTLLFALSPYVFLFTTVAYSEGLFLFFTLGAWYLFKKGKAVAASGLAAISVLARFVGALLVLPMCLMSVRKNGARRIRWVAFILFPVAAMLSWLAYCQVAANDFLAFGHATEWNGLYTVRTLLLEGLPKNGFSVFQTALQNTAAPLNWLSPFAVVVAIAVPPFLIYLVAKMEKSLAIYALITYVWILMFGALASVPRYISTLFPLWLPLASRLSTSKKSIVFLGIASVVSLIISVSLWFDFLNGLFVA
jgi:hypothetical protein